ncbi:MAG TPA: biotin--[acetyl-CoA-carboxylase] ligase, partial [Methylomirabilota bacterium]|nr:biotin--[acetyl-CoA-carboxylase] ligase [Methylomirabilota bacterium]
MSAPHVVRVGTVVSTQDVAFDLAARGAADRTVVLADHQTAGRGRQGRTWHDAPGASLLVSILVRPALDARSLPWLSYVAAIAVAEALQEATGLAPRLKWPNDVLVDDRKVAGILLQTRLSASTRGDGAATASNGPSTQRAGLAAALTVIGVGINLEPGSVTPELADRATSVREAGGRPVDREALLGAVVAALEVWRARLEREGPEPIRRRWLAL